MAMVAGVKTKDPEAVLDYGIDWSDWLQTGETIATSTWTVPAGITKDTDSHSSTGTLIWLSGGTVGEIYDVVNHIVTDSSPAREDDRTLRIVMQHK